MGRAFLLFWQTWNGVANCGKNGKLRLERHTTPEKRVAFKMLRGDRALKLGAGVRVNFAIQGNLFKLRRSPLHGKSLLTNFEEYTRFFCRMNRGLSGREVRLLPESSRQMPTLANSGSSAYPQPGTSAVTST